MGKAATIPTSAGIGAGATTLATRRPEPPSSRPPSLIDRIAPSAQLPLDRLEQIAQTAIDPDGRGRLVADVDHAVLAPGVLAVTILVPLGVVQQVREAVVVGVGDQVAG